MNEKKPIPQTMPKGMSVPQDGSQSTIDHNKITAVDVSLLNKNNKKSNEEIKQQFPDTYM